MLLNKNKMYKKMLFTNATVILLVLLVMGTYFNYSIRKIKIEESQQVLTQAVHSMNEYLVEVQSERELISGLLYQSSHQITDLVNFMTMPLPDYFEDKLDELYSGNLNYNSYGTDVTGFTQRCFELSQSLKQITLLAEKKTILGNKYYTQTVFERSGDIYTLPNNNKNSQMKFPELATANETLYYIHPVINPDTRQEVGQLVLTYDISHYDEIFKEFNSAELLKEYHFTIIDGDRNVVYDRANRYDEELDFEWTNQYIDEDLLEEELNSYVQIVYHSDGLVLVGQVPKVTAEAVPGSVVWLLFIIAAIIFTIAMLIVYNRLKKMSDRMDTILDNISQVRQGNFDAVIEETSEDDELGVIVKHFNDMCRDLKLHIEQNYLLEIEQKKAEMRVLENQINPHFLYNTLESIRMKALGNGEREVAKMIYGLATLFRSQVKDSPIVTLSKELDYCKKYLVIFEYRYENQFKFHITCSKEQLDNQILKFTLQPIIENYFVHGIRIGEVDNEINIDIIEDGQYLTVHISDNGKGMTDENIEALNYKLKNNLDNNNSIGITNVHQRIVMNFGQEYGLFFKHGEGKGVHVIITLPNLKGEL